MDALITDTLTQIETRIVEELNTKFLRPQLKKVFESIPNAAVFCQCNGGAWIELQNGERIQDYEAEEGSEFDKLADMLCYFDSWSRWSSIVTSAEETESNSYGIPRKEALGW